MVSLHLLFQYSLFYVDEGSGDGPDEGYRFGNTHEFTALSLLFIYNDYTVENRLHIFYFIYDILDKLKTQSFGEEGDQCACYCPDIPNIQCDCPQYPQCQEGLVCKQVQGMVPTCGNI